MDIDGVKDGNIFHGWMLWDISLNSIFWKMVDVWDGGFRETRPGCAARPVTSQGFNSCNFWNVIDLVYPVDLI